MIPALLIAAVVGYLAASLFYLRWMLSFQVELRKWGAGLTAFAAIALGTAGVLALTGTSATPLPRSSLAILILTASSGLVFILVRLARHAPIWGTVLAPLSLGASLALVLKWGMGATPSVATEMSTVTLVHVSATLLGFVLFIPAYVLSVLFLDQEHNLRTKQLAGPRLGGLLSLERNGWRLLYVGFPLFTLGIVLGIVGQDASRSMNVQPQHVIAAISWCIYAWAIARRLRSGWRGRRAALTLMAAFVMTFCAVLLYSMR